MTILIGVLVLSAAAAGIAAARFYFLRRALGNAAQLMAEINERQRTGCGGNQKLVLTAPDGALERLLGEMNQELAYSQQERIYAREREREFRKQIANISHDLRTPLTSILGYLELLSDPGIAESEREEYLDIVSRKSRSLQELITSFYDLSRLESHEYSFQLTELNLHDLLCGALASFYEDLETAGFQVETELTAELPAVPGDVQAVKRVFFNLLQNVLNHGSGQVRIRQWHEAGQVVTQVSNEAPGMRPETADQVFERFFTADEMRTGQNTGLGMTIVRGLLRGMGHEASAQLESVEGREWFTVEIRWNAVRGQLCKE